METAVEFISGVRRCWSAPSLDGLSALLAPDVMLVQSIALLAAAASRPSGWRRLWRSGAATALLRPKGRPDADRVQL